MAILPLHVLQEQALLTWGSVLVGFVQKWLTRDDVVQFAVDWLTVHPSDVEQSVLLLAGSEQDTDEQVAHWLRQAAKSKEGFSIDDDALYEFEMGKWRYAHLSALNQSDQTNEQKLDSLEKIYADFGYPQDMASFSKYGSSRFAIEKGYASPSDVPADPLNSMRALIAKLRGTYTNAEGTRL